MESQVVTWTVESNESDHWALWVRVGGDVIRMSDWFADRTDLLNALRHALPAVSRAAKEAE